MGTAVSFSTALLLVFSSLAGCIQVLEDVAEVLGCSDEEATNFDPNATSGSEDLCLFLENEARFLAAMTDAMAAEPSSYLLDPASGISGVQYSTMIQGIDAESGMSITMEALSIIMVDLESESMYNRTSISCMELIDIDTEVAIIGTDVMVTKSLGGPMASEIGEAGTSSSISRDMTPNLEEAVRAASMGLSTMIGMECLMMSGGMGSNDGSMSIDDPLPTDGLLTEDADVVITYDPDTGLQSMSTQTIEEDGIMTIVIRLHADGSFHSYDMSLDGEDSNLSMSFAFLSPDMTSIPEIDYMLDRTATPISVEVEVMVVCDDGGLVPEWAVMDGWEDCEDGSDEANEESTDDDNSAIQANDLYWKSYLGGHCEWEGNPDDVDEDRWSCEGDISFSDWDTWWYYCENHDEDWFCTDDYGQEPNHEYSADNENYNESNASEEDPSWVDGISWEIYPRGYCEWEGNPDDVDEDRWSCKRVEWDNWWYYCENHDEDWFCTDGYGQNPDHEYSADNENYTAIDHGDEEICISEDEDGVIHYECEEDHGGLEYPIVMNAKIVNQIYNAPITDFELRFLDCSEVGSEDHSELVWTDCSVVMSFPLSGGVIENVTVEYFDIDGDGMVSSGDISAVGYPAGFDHDYEIQPYDTWAEEYSADSALVGPELPGFGAFLSLIGLLGAALAGRHEKR